MKIVKVDNHNRESYNYPDKLICENIDAEHGLILVSHLNTINKDHNYFYKLVFDNYILQNYDPNK
jgi:hypothetical protein